MLHRRDFLLATSAAALVPTLGWAQTGEDAKLNGLFDVFVQENLRRRPESATQLGLDKGANAALLADRIPHWHRQCPRLTHPSILRRSVSSHRTWAPPLPAK